jgi:hypothetical protein
VKCAYVDPAMIWRGGLEEEEQKWTSSLDDSRNLNRSKQFHK